MKTRHILLVLLAMLTTSFVAPAQPKNPDGLFLKKNVVEDTEHPNKYSINLEAFVTGIKSSTGDLDVVLVLDASSSMTKEHDKRTRMSYLHDAANAFVDQLYDVDSDGHFRIALVRYSSKGSEYSYIIRNLTQLTGATINDIKNDINGIAADGGTYMSAGLNLAYDILTNPDDKKDCMKYVIVLTDGLPTSDTPVSDYGAENAYKEVNDCTDWSYQLKNLKTLAGKKNNAKIYSIGLCVAETDKIVQSSVTYTPKLTIGDYLSRVSSKYLNVRYFKAKSNEPKKYTWRNTTNDPNSTNPDPAAVNPEDTQYIYFASTPAELEGIFKGIGEEISEAAIPLSGEATSVVDIVSNSFKLPDSAFDPSTGELITSNIKMYASKCIGQKSLTTEGDFEFTFDDEHMVELPNSDLGFGDVRVVPQDDNKKKITVTGFDFEKFFVHKVSSSEFAGYKLVVKFPIVIDPAFPGGASAVTNEEGSGIYFDADGDGKPEQIGWFPIPTVKVPNLVVVKYGLHKGESAIFNVYKLDDATGERSQYPIQLVATQGDGDFAMAKIKIQKPGRYEVEETSWSWAYDITKCESQYAVDDTNVSDDDFKKKGYGPGELFPIPAVKGSTATSKSITRNVNDFTEEASILYNYTGTFFIFTNKAKENIPAHAEANKNNEFYIAN